MRRIYVIGHWSLTLLLAPFTSQAIDLIYGKNPHQLVGLLEVYPISLLLSIAFSIPTLLVYIACFYFLTRQHMNFAVSKFILIAITVSGIYITQTIIDGSMSLDIIIAYAVTSIIVGLVLRLKVNNTKTQDNCITT